MPADPILGPAWPALLAPGLRVCLDGYAGAGTLLGDPDAPDDGWWLVWDSDVYASDHGVGVVGPLSPAALVDLRVDYRDPLTRDNVCRALWRHFGRTSVNAPTLWRCDVTSEWVLWRGHEQDSITFAPPKLATGWTPGSDEVAVPALRGVRDPILALREIAAAVWGAS